ncbi:Golgi transport complex subunit 4 [Phytophthora boehmeriae]|uniref:Conserved oligomeric Golgi complex subunit 4 n=1 Tax=Phytophthora boehmeriae TaxID=109152 RepID=A0A8T1VRH0_9STRA|nr:Golgi transport complex subunit 4 [Phytophthora boehmeriae]
MGAPSRRKQRLRQHEALVARLAAVKLEQQTLRSDALAFAEDPAASEKAAAQRCLRSLRQLTPEVTVLCAQTGAVVERVANANDVAEKMTREVRRLDVIQSRLGVALAQSAQLLTLRNALAGIRRAMQQQRYPEAATFLQTLKTIEQQMPLDVADKLRVDTIENDLKAVIEGAFEEGLRAGDTRQVQTYAPLFQAVGKDYEEHGLVMLLEHTQKTLDETLKREGDPRVGVFSSQELITHLAGVFNTVAQEAQLHAELLSQCFQRVRGPNRFVAKLYKLGEQSSCAVLTAYMAQRKFHERIANGIEPRSPTAATPLSPSNRSGSTRSMQGDPGSPKDDGVAVMNEQLNEMALVIQHTQTYERFMRSRVLPETYIEEGSDEGEEARDDEDVVKPDDEKIVIGPVLPPIQESELGKTVQELAGFYCFFENALLNQAARKAFQWEELHYSSGDGNSGSDSTIDSGADGDDGLVCFPISSAIDEIFYVARNSGLRALATGHVDCAAGVLNMINTVLRDVVGDSMRSRIRHMTTSARLDNAGASSLLAASSAQLRDQMQQQFAKLSKTVGPVGGVNAGEAGGMAPEQRKEHAPDVVLNSLEVTSGYIAQLKGEFEHELPEAFPEVPQHILTCLNALEDASAELKQLLLASRKKLLKLFEPKITSFLTTLLSGSSSSSAASALAASATALSSSGSVSSRRSAVQYELTEAMFTFNEANDPFAHAFVSGLRSLLGFYRGSLSRCNYRAIVQGVAECSASQLESWFLSRATRVNQLGALQFDKDVRVLSTFLGGEGGAGDEVREAFASLTQISEVLNVDTPEDVVDIFGRRRRGVAWTLPAARVKEVLSRRVEFGDAAINKLVLK